MAELVFYRRGEELMRVALDGRRLVVGRAPNCDILVPEPSVSRQQFALERQEGSWMLKDLSGRGTDVTGSPVAEAELLDGADVGLGPWRAVFNLEGRGAPVPEATLASGRGHTAVVERPTTTARSLPAALRVKDSTGERLVPFQREAVVGTGEACTVRVEDPFVSTVHLRIERRDGAFAVRDLQSRNGTFVGALRIQEAEVPLGCPILIGRTEIVPQRAEKEGELPSFEGMVGRDPAMRRVFETIERVAPSQAAVAIFGESGTGKELVARAIHARSPRASNAFVPVNCGALNKELIESELFGHEKGAFTGAERLRKGAFEEADGGTLFLDEIGELPIGLQAKLLRALELGEIKRVGATRPMNVDVRVVAATNKDLRAEIKGGAFREDLYWRLCVIPVQLPPVRARKSDLRPLIHHFLVSFSPQGTPVALSPEAEAKLLEHDWPGNVRELKNTIHRCLLLRRSDVIAASDIIFTRDIEPAAVSEAETTYDPDADDLNRVYIVGKSQERIDDEVFVKTVRRLGTSPSVVAKALGQSRGAAYRRMAKLGITPGGDPKDLSADDEAPQD